MNDTMLRTAKFFQKSCHRNEMEEFLETARSTYEGTGRSANFGAAQVRAQGFRVVCGGYNFAQVDAIMDRLESAFMACARADHMAVNDQEAWVNLVSEQTTMFHPRLLRPAGKRSSCLKGREHDYRSADVDTLLERPAAYFGENKPLTSRGIRDTVLAESKGIRAYAEGPVGVYLVRAVGALLAVE